MPIRPRESAEYPTRETGLARLGSFIPGGAVAVAGPSANFPLEFCEACALSASVQDHKPER
jgi:hypothetical protein